MSDAIQVMRDLLAAVDERMSQRLKIYRPNLARSTGVTPSRQLPAAGNTGSGYTPAAHAASHYTTDPLDLGSLPGSLTLAQIPNGLITYAKLQNVSATDRLLGRASAGAGVVEEIPLTAAGRALIAGADAAAQRATLGAITGAGTAGHVALWTGAASQGENAALTFSGATLKVIPTGAADAGLQLGDGGALKGALIYAGVSGPYVGFVSYQAGVPIRFYSNPVANTGAAQRMFITSEGVVRIGASSPVLTGAGDLDVAGAVRASGYRVGTLQVLGARNTGWTAMTGTANKATAYDTATITLAQMAGRLKALLDALTAHGIIG